MSQQGVMMHPVVVWIRVVIRMALFALALMWPAGTWYWQEAWAVVVLWTLFIVVMTIYLMKHDPGLLAERMQSLPIQKDQKRWDKIIMSLFVVAGVALYIVPGFDVVRYQWSEPLPQWLRVVALVLQIPCFLMLGWIMRENSYLAQVVKIDKDRAHKVITTGAYAWVRHPMYTVIIVLFFLFPLSLGSRYALLLSGLITILLIIRTYLEDRTLYHELEGYPEYTQQTPYRLLPGVW